VPNQISLILFFVQWSRLKKSDSCKIMPDSSKKKSAADKSQCKKSPDESVLRQKRIQKWLIEETLENTLTLGHT
jgi:hypothetical protein